MIRDYIEHKLLSLQKCDIRKYNQIVFLKSSLIYVRHSHQTSEHRAELNELPYITFFLLLPYFLKNLSQ